MTELFLDLIKRSLFGAAFDIPNDADFAAVLREARAQAIVGLIAPVVPDRFHDEWSPYANQTIINYIRNMHAQDELLRVFSAADIPTAILKGAAAAVYYPVPSRRTMGDIDFIVPQDRFEDACALMETSGYTVSHQEEGYFRHIGYSKNGVTFELHHHFSYIDLDIERYITDGMKQLELQTFDGHSFPMLPRLANGLVLLAHMRSHLRSGLGLRQVIDWMMYVYREMDDVFWSVEFMNAAAGVGLEKLAVVATRMCQIYLGLSNTITWCKGADEDLCAELMDNLLTSGNFGRKNGSGGSVEKVSAAIRREGLFHYLQHAGKHNWKAYHRHHWLAPFCWFYQICRYARQGFSTGRSSKKLREDISRGKDRSELLKKLDLE